MGCGRAGSDVGRLGAVGAPALVVPSVLASPERSLSTLSLTPGLVAGGFPTRGDGNTTRHHANYMQAIVPTLWQRDTDATADTMACQTRLPTHVVTPIFRHIREL